MHVDPGAPELALLWRVQDICEQAQSMDNVFDLAFAGDKAACMQLRKGAIKRNKGGVCNLICSGPCEMMWWLEV